MNLRKLRRERASKASTATVDSERVAARALPAGDTSDPDARTISVEPLTEPAAGREEARAAFVRDTGGDAPPRAETAPGASDAAPGAQASDAQPEVTVDGMVTMVVGALDGAATMFGPRLVGGDAALWAQSEKESASLAAAARPVAAKLMSETPITPEAMLLGTLAFIYLPRAFAGVMERAAEKRDKRRQHGNAHDVVDARPVVTPAPPPAPASPASPASPAVPAEPAPAPKVTPVEEPTSVSDFLRSIRGGK